MTVAMGLYRILISIYYSKKSFASISFVLAVLVLVYFYLPQLVGPTTGSYYLNPRVNKMPVKQRVYRSEDAESGKLKLIKIPDYLTEINKCPACFGKDLCPKIDSGAIKIVEPDADDELKIKGVYNGYWNGKPVVIKRLNRREEYDKMDAFLCKNATLELSCDVSKAILSGKSLAQSKQIFTPDFLRSMWGIIHERSDQLAVAACLSQDAIKVLSEDFDLNSDDHLSAEEKGHFFTSLVLNPESLILKFTKKEGLQIHFPEVLGHCGRIVVTEHAGQPLSSFLKEDFKKRADLGMMLLGMIFFLQNFSSKWSLVFSDFNFDNFYVKEDNIYIVDAEDMLLTDTVLYPAPKDDSSTVCNADCFKHFSLRLFDYARVPRENVCPDTPRVTEQAMYALACERIFSYLPEHRKYSPYEGLLHNPPAEIANLLETSLKECVYETQKDRRIEAIDVISNLLQKYVQFDQFDYNDDYQKEAGITDKPRNRNPNPKIIEQSPNQGTGNQIPNQTVPNQIPNQGTGNQIPNQAVANQIPNQGTGNQIPDQGTGNQIPNQGTGNQIPNQRTGNQIPNQGTGNQVLNQSLANQIPDQLVANQIPIQGTGNQIPNQRTGNQIPNQGTGNQIPNQAVANQIPNQGTGNEIPNQGTGNQIPNQRTGNQIPNQGTGNQIPNQGTGNQIPNQAVANQIPNQGTGNQIPNQPIPNQIPNQGTGNKY